MYLATDFRHGSSYCSNAKHDNGHDEANDLDERHPVGEERTTHQPHRDTWSDQYNDAKKQQNVVTE